jgi:hypothetical protein
MKSFVALNVTPVAPKGSKSGQMTENKTTNKEHHPIGKTALEKGRRISVAPMLDWTD